MKKPTLLLAVTLIIFLTWMFFLVPHAGFSQSDIIYKKSGGVIPCRVREIKVDVIKYVRVDIKRGPIIEIRKDEVYKIRYRNGTIDVLDLEFVMAQKADTIKGNKDTTGYSTLYVVYNSGQSSQVFPLVINGQYVCRMSNHSRLVFKMHYKGEVQICRQMKSKMAPCRQFVVQPGQIYGVSISVENETAIDPNFRFSMTVFDDTLSVKDFIQSEYYSFKPFKENDYNYVEKTQ